MEGEAEGYLVSFPGEPNHSGSHISPLRKIFISKFKAKNLLKCEFKCCARVNESLLVAGFQKALAGNNAHSL